MAMQLYLPIILVPALAAPAFAEPARLIVSKADVATSDGRVSLEIVALNADPSPLSFAAPATLPATLSAPGSARETIILRPASSQPERVTITPGGFARFRYEGELPAGTANAALSLAIEGAPAVALSVGGDAPALASTAPAATSHAASHAPVVPVSTGSSRDNPFLANLSAYEPTYFVYGPGTDTSGRIQISLKYQIFGRRGNWLDGITFAYTQRMFWDLEADSAPFRDVNYMPELFYLVPTRDVGDGISLGGRFCARHESNGRSGVSSRALNTLYVQPEATIPLGRFALTLGPRLWAYVGPQDGNEDIERYRGHTGLYVAFGEDEGLRLSLTSRLNIGSGKGAVDGVLSYPLAKMWASGPQLYLIAQGFAGYGESLLDYNHKEIRARIGFGITR